MPTDIQIIDSFERLRDRFTLENPAFRPAERQKPAETSAEGWVVEGWLQAVEGVEAVSSAQQRRLRAQTRAILRGDGGGGGGGGNGESGGGEKAASYAGLLEGKLGDLAARIPDALEQARRRGLWPLAQSPEGRTLTEEVRLWARCLPGLTGLKAWRLLERLGRPVLVPEQPVRRFLWRMGLIEQAEGARADQQVQSRLEWIAGLSGIAPALLATLVRWLVSGERDLAGGRWCAARPRCAECPLGPGCAWARFHPAEPPEERRDSQRSLEPLHRQIATGRQEQLQEVELLSLLLQRGVAGMGAFELAELLLRRFGGARGLERATLTQLAEIKGISSGRAIQLKAALELGRRLATQALQTGDPITCSNDIWRAFRSRFRHLPQEHFVIVLLDAKNRVLHDHIVSKGTLTGSLAHPREVFQEAIRHAAAGVILMHNHPSGDPQPSRDDRAVTTRLKEAGDILGIRVLDHIVLGADDYFSFKDEGDL